MNKKRYRKINRLVAIVMAWVVVAQSVAPNLVLAEEIATESVEPVSSETTQPETTSTEQTMDTGDAQAAADSAALANTTLVGESEIEVTNAQVGGTEDLIPFASSSPMPIVSLSPTPSASPEPELTITPTEQATPSGELDLTINNAGEVEVAATASANTGTNTQINEVPGDNSTSEMTTGEATAIASAVAVVNTTLVDSSLQVGTVSVVEPWSGNLVLDPDNIEEINSQNLASGGLRLSIDNEGNVQVEANSTAETGGNTQIAGGEAEMTTGQAAALTSAAAVVGYTGINTQATAILAENFWLWDGQILNWAYPGSVQTPMEIFGSQSGSGGGCLYGCSSGIDVKIDNQADVRVFANAEAVTGNNTQISSGSAQLDTGNAKAGATATAVVNTTLIGSRLTLLHLLLFAPWTGNLVFAYPDVETKVEAPASVSEGEEIKYQLKIKNLGYKRAEPVNLQLRVRAGEEEIYQTTKEIQGLNYLEGWEEELKIASSGRGGQLLTLEIAAVTGLVEVSQTNNQAAATTMVMVQEPNKAEGDGKKEVPLLHLDSSNNAENGIYPGNGVAYQMRASNEGPITAHNVYLVQEFYTPEGEFLTEMMGRVGEIAVSGGKNIHFIMTPGGVLNPGEYYTISYLVGESDQGEATVSNEVTNGIPILGQLTSILIPTAKADEGGESEEEGQQVLGAGSEAEVCTNCQAEPWYIGVAFGSLAYFLVTRRKQEFFRTLKWGLTLPLAGYAGLLYTQGDCRNGLMLVEGVGYWCKYFLPYAYALYGGVGWLTKLLAPKKNSL